MTVNWWVNEERDKITYTGVRCPPQVAMEIAAIIEVTGDIIKVKWLSVDNHIHNIFVGHGELSPQCEHPPLPRRGRSKKWFKPRKFVVTAIVQSTGINHCTDTKASEKVSAIISKYFALM